RSSLYLPTVSINFRPKCVPLSLTVYSFAAVTVAVIDHPCRGGNAACLTDTTPDMSQTQIRVTNGSTQTAQAGVDVRVWKVRSISPYLSQEIASGQTGAGGIFEFDWRGDFNNFDQLMLVKVSPREVRHDPSG
ncbi:MAG: hypothetical protein QGH54_06070, partial [SAR202 cluster bacterium]|nr:hypothetical protein [SAR202 cluster bacterium]